MGKTGLVLLGLLFAAPAQILAQRVRNVEVGARVRIE